ncbi:MAG TPA: GIDE domain-containing protein [Desulfosalsimonadaceae bacterium]|nr:GIDE domain-containing protein [Desulfosalsimonadaceae bacterium]
METPTDILVPGQQPNQTPDTSASDAAPAGEQYILFRRLSKLPKNPDEMLQILETASGVDQTDLRYRLAGPGFGLLRPKIARDAVDACIADMTDFGIPAAVVAKSDIAIPELPPQARRIHFTEDFIEFQTAEEEPIFRVDETTDLLIILTDLSGKAVKQIMTTIAYTSQVQEKPFEEILKKLSMSSAAAVFYDIKGNPAKGVFIDSTAFTFLGLNDKLSPSVAVNFRTIVDEAIGLADTHAVDYYFGIAALPGAKPDWDAGSRSIERRLGVYSHYMLAAHRNGLFTAPDPSTERAEAMHEETWDDTEEAADKDAAGLEPPPPVEQSRFMGIFKGSASETTGTLFAIAAILFFTVGNIEALTGHSRLWPIILGIAVSAAGAALFCYSLLLLYYKRMVENTPTSKIRSHSMGMTELTGRARPYYDLRTSHTLTQCIFFECRYYRYQRTDNGQQWRLTRTVSSGKLPFYIEDDTGRVLVNPKGAYYSLTRARQTIRGRFIPTLAIKLDDPNTRVIEDLIAIGAKVYVLGSAHLQRHGQTHRERLMDKLRSVKQDASKMARYDQNGDGHIDAEEWDAAREDIEHNVYAESLTSGSGDYETVVIEKPKFGVLPFIVADSEKGLLRKFAIRSWLFFASGALAFACGIGMLM